MTKSLLALAFFLVLSGSASAQEWVVTQNTDSVPGSLRDAVSKATDGDTITFDPLLYISPPTNVFLGAQLDINKNLTITGPGAKILRIVGQGSGGLFRLFNIVAGSTVRFSGLTFMNGYIRGDNGIVGTYAGLNSIPPTAGTAGQGGAIVNSGDLTLTECVLTNNAVLGGPGGSGAPDSVQSPPYPEAQNGGAGGDALGGAIYSDGTALSIVRCTFSANTATGGAGGSGNNADFGPLGNGAAAGSAWGGAIYVAAGTASISNSTFSGSTAAGGTGGSGGSHSGGPIGTGGVGGDANGGAISTTQPLTLVSCTIANNLANPGLGGYSVSGNFNQYAASGTARGGIHAGGTVTIGNTLAAGNTTTNPVTSTTTELDVVGAFTSLNYNLIAGLDNSATGFTGAADQSGTLVNPLDAKMNTLADNGGQMQTISLKKGPAVNKGKDLNSAAVDQRNLPRPNATPFLGYILPAGGDGSDIGAFEAQTDPNIAPTTTNQAFSGGTQGTLFDDPAHKLTGNDADSDTLTFILVSGTMPAGLTLNSDGTVTGTPTAPSQAQVTFKANDGGADSNISTLTFDIKETPSLVVNTDIDNSTDYDGLTSLREAIRFSGSQNGTVTFDPTFFATSKTITLTSMINYSTYAITGPPSGVTLSGGNTKLLFFITASGTISFQNLTLANGKGVDGGAFFIDDPNAHVTFTNCTLKNNTAQNRGGAIALFHGVLTLNNCTFSGNQMSSPTVGTGGGAISQFGGSLTIHNCTISGNTCSNGSNGGGGILLSSGVCSLGNSIVANNSDSSAIGPDIVGSFNSLGFNIIGDTTGTTITGTTTGNQLNVDPLLDPNGLKNNGGPTETIALMPGSPAIDAGKAMGGVTTDQRGSRRPSNDPLIADAAGGDGSDIGAFEVQQKMAVTTSAATNVTSFTATLNGTVATNELDADTVSIEYGTSTSYGTTVAATPASVAALTTKTVSAALDHLPPNTTYHFRVNAVNTDGTINGADQSFTTAESSLSISSGPTASPAVAGVGQTVTFSVGATDTAGNTLIYSWDIAGTASTDASPTRVFTTPGTYTASVTVVTSVGGSVTGSVSVTVNAPVVGSGNDSDGDGFSDDFETGAGTNPNNASDSPSGGGPAPLVADLVQSKLSIKLNFAKPGNDSISFGGMLPIAAGFTPTGKTVVIDVGGVIKSVALDAKGKSPKGTASFGVTLKAKKGVVAAQTAKYSVKLTKGNFASSLEDEDLTNSDAKKASVSVIVRIVFAGAIYEHTQKLSYTATKGKSGSAR